MATLVEDPSILAQLNQRKPVTDPSILFELNSAPERHPAPGSEPLNYGQMMRESIGDVGEALMTRGPLQAGGAMVGEGIENLGKLMERGAYKTGEFVTDTLAPHVPAEVAGGAGYVANVGMQALPVVLGATGAERLTKPALDWAAKRTMQSALKPSKKTLKSGDAKRAIQTMLDEGINVSEGGARKLREIADKLDDIVTTELAGSNAAITKERVLDAIVKKLKKAHDQGNPLADEAAITKVWDEFDQVFDDLIPVEQAQKIKRGTQQSVSKKYGELASADIEGQKALAAGLREGISDAVPGVAAPNASNANILNALGLVEDRAAMAGNLNLSGLAGAGNNPLLQALMMLDRSSVAKSLLARFLNTGARPIATAGGAGAGALVGANAGDRRSLNELIQRGYTNGR